MINRGDIHTYVCTYIKPKWGLDMKGYISYGSGRWSPHYGGALRKTVHGDGGTGSDDGITVTVLSTPSEEQTLDYEQTCWKQACSNMDAATWMTHRCGETNQSWK